MRKLALVVAAVLLISYDSAGSPLRICGSSTAGLVNAFYCTAGDIVAWDRGELLPMLTDSFGEISVVAVLAHELGHAVQFRLGLPQAAPSIVKEQQADCYTGAYFRWVAEGSSDQFEVSTGPGLNQILSTLFFIRDSAGTSFSADGAHGNAFDRVSAFQFGFTSGAARCAKIDAAEVQSRVTQTGFAADEPDVGLGKGNLRVDDKQALQDLTDSLRIAFPAVAPFTTGQSACPKPTSAAAFCPSGDAVTVNLKQLVKIGTPPQRGGKGGIGDFAAFAEVASRHALAAQKAAGQPIEGPVAAQRTACLTGAWAGTIVEGKNEPLRLSPGDLDEVVLSPRCSPRQASSPPTSTEPASPQASPGWTRSAPASPAGKRPASRSPAEQTRPALVKMPAGTGRSVSCQASSGSVTRGSGSGRTGTGRSWRRCRSRRSSP